MDRLKSVVGVVRGVVFQFHFQKLKFLARFQVGGNGMYNACRHGYRTSHARSRLRVAQAPRSPLATRPTVHVSRFFIDQVLSFFLRGDINRGVYSMMYEGAQSKVLDHQAVVVW